MPLLRFHTAGVRVDLDCPDAALAGLVADVGAAMLTDDGAPAVVTVTAPVVSGTRPAGSRAPVASDGMLEAAAAQAISLVDRAALRHTPCLTVHAAALAGPAGCVVVPGASGVGKTTLAGAGMQLGLSLLSDEAACFTRRVGELVPHPRPLGLSLASRGLLGLAGDDEPDCEQATAPELLGKAAEPSYRGACVLVAVPDRRRGAHAALSDITGAEALAALLGSCLNVPPLDSRGGWPPAEAWRYLGTLVAGVRTVRVTFDEPYAAARLLADALGV